MILLSPLIPEEAVVKTWGQAVMRKRVQAVVVEELSSGIRLPV